MVLKMVNILKKNLLPFFSKEETEINNSILDLVDTICQEQIDPFAREMDSIGAKIIDGKVKLPPKMYDIIDTFRKNDLFGLTVPEQFGGSGLTSTLFNAVLERIARSDASSTVPLSLQGALIDYILYYGSTELQEKYLPAMASGESLGGFLYTEPQSGSDLGSVKTKAVKDGDNYIINGSKIFISNAGVSNVFTLLASTDSSKGSNGLTAFILDTRDQPGFKVNRLEKKLGLNASPTGQITMDDVVIPAENRLGQEGKGLGIILFGLSLARITVGSGAVGVADAAYRKAIKYVSERKQFGQRIIDFQGTQWKIADMATKIETARSYYLYASRLKDLKKKFFEEASIAKLYGSEIAQEVCYEAIQMHGGYGFIKDYDVERYYRDVRINTIFDGTSEIQKLIIFRDEAQKFTN